MALKMTQEVVQDIDKIRKGFLKVGSRALTRGKLNEKLPAQRKWRTGHPELRKVCKSSKDTMAVA